MASLQRSNFGHFCTGTLITKQHILTAYHCLDKEKDYIKQNDYLVVLNEFDLQQNGEGEIYRSVNEVFVHPSKKYASFFISHSQGRLKNCWLMS
jgi:V8-like Glu-specific endopeptidase